MGSNDTKPSWNTVLTVGIWSHRYCASIGQSIIWTGNTRLFIQNIKLHGLAWSHPLRLKPVHPMMGWLHVSSSQTKLVTYCMVRIIGPQTSDTFATLAHYFSTHHLPHLTPSTCTQTYAPGRTHRRGSFTASAVSSSKNDWACDSFYHCRFDTKGEGERVKRMTEDDKREGCWKNLCFSSKFSQGWYVQKRGHSVSTQLFLYFLNYQYHWICEVSFVL